MMEAGVQAALVSLLVRIDGRRPASWLACGIAAAAVAGLAATAGGVDAVAAAIACGGWAAAAVGRPPAGPFPGMPRLAAVWWVVRAAWPLIGCLAAAAGGWFMAGDGVAIGVGCGLGVAVAVAVAAKAAACGAAAADATSLGLVCSAATAAAGMGGRSVSESLACAGAATAVIAAATWSAGRWGRGWSWTADGRPRAAATFADLAMFRGGLRWALSALAMATSLVGMAAWYFLAPTAAAVGMLAALGWFTALAAPAATLGPPWHGGWARLAATAGGAETARRSAGPLAAGRWAAAVACGYAALLGWPPLVAGLLRTAESGLDPLAAGVWPWLTVAALAVAAAVLVVLVRCATFMGCKAETALAGAACLAVAALVGVLPALRGLPKGPAETRVEKMARWER
jgi:hypothetical protein